MNEGKIAVRYAKALYLTASEQDLLESVKMDIILISDVLKNTSIFRDFLNNPVSKPSECSFLVNRGFGEGRIQKITLNFLEIIIQNSRISYLEGIMREFFTIYRRSKGVKSATLITARDLSIEYKEKFQTVLKKIYKTEIELSHNTEPSIIGGFVLTVEDQQYNASISNELNKIRTSLKSEK